MAMPSEYKREVGEIVDEATRDVRRELANLIEANAKLERAVHTLINDMRAMQMQTEVNRLHLNDRTDESNEIDNDDDGDAVVLGESAEVSTTPADAKLLAKTTPPITAAPKRRRRR